jgi:hypothetical protein
MDLAQLVACMAIFLLSLQGSSSLTIVTPTSAATITQLPLFEQHRRRAFLWNGFSAFFVMVGIPNPTTITAPSHSIAHAAELPLSSSFQSKLYERREYTNSITASRDTNVSPAEVYDVIRQQIPPASDSQKYALDLGAGAGLSTVLLYSELGYRTVDAVDWSATAWEENVIGQPDSVHFYEMDDTTFFQTRKPSSLQYDVIVYNFAVNADKAAYVARNFLTESGVLLAPINDKRDYWYKQTYFKLNSRAEIVWQSEAEVGAWSVQFQPDVTSPSCTGIWCGNFNGFRKP